jgi:chromosome partitioning protein
VLDTPAGLHGKRCDAVLRVATHLIIPLQPSLFDIQATHAFVSELRAHKRGAELKLAVLGNRVKDNTISADQLHSFLETLKLPVLGTLRDTQNYVHLAARGLTLWDVAPSRVERDLPQWLPVIDWVNA